MEKKKTYCVPKLLSLGLACCLIMSTLWGCSKKEVDYEGLDEKETNTGTNSSMAQFADEKTWSEKWTVTDAGGKELEISVNAKVTVPDVDSMSVVEVEQTGFDEEWREQFIHNYFGETPVYYHDVEYYTREELNEQISANEEEIAILENSNQEGIEEIIEFYRDNIAYEQELLANAGDELTVAEEFSSCNTFLGYVEEIPCEVNFVISEEGTTSSVFAYHVEGPAFEAETDFDYANMSRIGGQSPENEGNICKMSLEEARSLADAFISQLGRKNQVCYDEQQTIWMRMDTAGEMDAAHMELVVYGYTFTYGTGVDDIAFSQFNNMDVFLEEDNAYAVGLYDGDTTEITVTDEGVIEVSISGPVTINHITPQVELLSLDTIKTIMKDEVMNNSGAYGELSKKPYFYAMDLIYCRVKDDAKEGGYSYVPTWRLSAKKRDVYIHPVLVNAIDGSVIHIEDEL